MPQAVEIECSRRRLLRELWISEKRNICQRLEMNIKNGDAGDLAGTVGSRAHLGNQGRSLL